MEMLFSDAMTIVSKVLAGSCEWVVHDSAMESDHCPVLSRIGGVREQSFTEREGRRIFHKANWEKLLVYVKRITLILVWKILLKKLKGQLER